MGKRHEQNFYIKGYTDNKYAHEKKIQHHQPLDKCKLKLE